MLKTVKKSRTRSKAAYVLLRVLEDIYGKDKKILSEKEHKNKKAMIWTNGDKYLRKFQEEYVGMPKGDGEATKNRGTWKKVLEVVTKKRTPSDSLDRKTEAIRSRKEELQSEMNDLGTDNPEFIRDSKRSIDIYGESRVVVDLPDWFINAKNDAVRVATLLEASKYFEQIAKRTDGGGNVKKIVDALKALNMEHFQNHLLKGKTDKQAVITLEGLKKALPGRAAKLNNEDYLSILHILQD